MKKPTILSGLATFAALALAAGAGMAQEPGEAPPKTPELPRPILPAIPKLETGSPNAWFERTKLFMGEFLDQESVSGKFPFKNPTDKTVQWRNIVGSCQCARAEIRIGDEKWELSKKPIANSLHQILVEDGKEVRKRVRHLDVAPGASGEVEVHMEMGGLQGYKDATLSLETSHEDMRQFTLAWQAKGVKLFEVTPNDVFLNNMTWSDKRDFKFVIESPVKPDFKLLDHGPLPDYVTVTKKQITLPNGRKAWQVDGTFGPNADPKAGGAAIKFKTDWDGKEVPLTVIATVTPPISIEPGTFLSFGKIRKGVGAEREIKFVPNDDFKLVLEGVKFPKLTFDEKYISTTSRQDGKNLIVTVKIAPEVQGSYLVRGAVELTLNHPSMAAKVFNFNGILR